MLVLIDLLVEVFVNTDDRTDHDWRADLAAWFKCHFVKGDHSTPFLKAGRRDKTESDLNFAQLIELTEHVYNLQPVPGVYPILQRIYNNPRGIEATMLELEGMRLLWLNGLRFKLKPTSAVTGERTYECDVLLPDGLEVPCEMKCKLEDTKLSESTIRRAIKDSRGQLPPDRYGVVIVKIPMPWGLAPHTLAFIKCAVRKELKMTNRVCEVLLYHRDYIPAGTKSLYPILISSVRNDNSKLLHQVSEGILKHGKPERSWVFFSQFTSPDVLRQFIDANPNPRTLDGS